MNNFRSGLQPSGFSAVLTWGFTPGRVGARLWRSRLAAAVLCLPMAVSGCKSSPPVVAPAAMQPAGPAYPPRSTDIPPTFKVFHQDDDTYTLVTSAGATDGEVSALMWQFRDAARDHTFDALHLSQKFIDARKPTVWFHVYRGAKCANEKFVKGAYPCGAKYNGAGDFTLGDYKNPAWNMGVLHNADGSETQLWDADAKS